MSGYVDVGITTTPPRRRRLCGLSFDKALQMFSSFFIPLILSIFTIVIAAYQHKVANDNRLSDAVLVREQRRQGLNMTDQQRDFNRMIRNEQRRADQYAFDIQREQARNLSILQRATDSLLNELRRKHKLNLIETNYLIKQQQREHDLAVANNLKQEGILDTYIQEASSLVWPLNSDISDEMVYAMKWETMTALRQFDGKRKAYILKYLIETGFLFNETLYKDINVTLPLDLKWSNFDGIDFRPDGITSKFNFTSLLCGNSTQRISLQTVRLSNGIFDNIIMKYVHFEESIFENASFQNVDIFRVSFIKAKLINTNFNGATVRECNFAEANLTGSTLTEQQLYEAFIENTIMPDGKILLFHNLIRQYFIHPVYKNWTEETNFTKLWQIYHKPNNNSQIRIEQSYNNLKEWRYDIYSRESLSIIRNITTPSKYKLWIKNNQALIIATIRCGFNIKDKLVKRSLAYDLSLSDGSIRAFIEQYDQNNNRIAVNSIGDIKYQVPKAGNPGSYNETLNSGLEYNPQTEYFIFGIVFQHLNSTRTTELVHFCENAQVKIVQRH